MEEVGEKTKILNELEAIRYDNDEWCIKIIRLFKIKKCLSLPKLIAYEIN